MAFGARSQTETFSTKTKFILHSYHGNWIRSRYFWYFLEFIINFVFYSTHYYESSEKSQLFDINKTEWKNCGRFSRRFIRESIFFSIASDEMKWNEMNRARNKKRNLSNSFPDEWHHTLCTISQNMHEILSIDGYGKRKLDTHIHIHAWSNREFEENEEKKIIKMECQPKQNRKSVKPAMCFVALIHVHIGFGK